MTWSMMDVLEELPFGHKMVVGVVPVDVSKAPSIANASKEWGGKVNHTLWIDGLTYVRVQAKGEELYAPKEGTHIVLLEF